MRTAFIAAGGVAFVVVAALAAFFTGVVDFGVTLGACQRDDEIEASIREGSSKAAEGFFTAMLNGDSESSYAALTPDLQKAIPRATFDTMVEAVTARGPFTDMKPAHAYKPSVVGRAGGSKCGGGETAVTVNAVPGVTQVHEVLTAQTASNGWALTAWMVEDGGAWHVRSFYTSLESMVGQDAAALFNLAKAQAKAGNAFNATLLYVGAGSVVERGPDMKLAIERDIADALAANTPPADLKGKAPFTWTFEDTKYTVEGITLTAAQSQLGFVIAHRDDTWDGKDNAAAAELNKKLIEGFKTAHPEYAEAFGFIVARIVSKDGSASFDTVFDKTNGYVEAAAPAPAAPAGEEPAPVDEAAPPSP